VGILTLKEMVDTLKLQVVIIMVVGLIHQVTVVEQGDILIPMEKMVVAVAGILELTEETIMMEAVVILTQVEMEIQLVVTSRQQAMDHLMEAILTQQEQGQLVLAAMVLAQQYKALLLQTEAYTYQMLVEH